MALIDRFLPLFHFNEIHECAVAASPSRVLDAVLDYRPETDPVFRAMIALREAPMRLFGRRSDRRARFGLDDFTLLGQNEDAIVYGLIGQFWRPSYGLVPIADGSAFLAFDDRSTAKLTLGFKVLRGLDGHTRLVTETRVYCSSGTARLKFTPYWLLIRPISGLLRWRILASIRMASEQSGLLAAAASIDADSGGSTEADRRRLPPRTSVAPGRTLD